MKSRATTLVLVVLALAISATTVAAAMPFLWTQGYHVGHGRDTNEFHSASRNGKTYTTNSIIRSSLRDASDSEAEALYCNNFKVSKPGVYLVTLQNHRLSGQLYADRIFGRKAEAWARVSLVLKIWQGAWPGTSGHKFLKPIHTVRSADAFDYPDHKYIIGSYGYSQTYTVVDVTKPLKVCGGQNTQAYVSKRGEASADFGKWDSANGYGRLSVELVR